jgi:hypothetical protein
MQDAYLLFDCFKGPQNLEVWVLHKHEGTQLSINFQIFLKVLQHIKLVVGMVKQVSLYLCENDNKN